MKQLYFFLFLFLFIIVGCKNTHKQSPESPETISINVDKVSDIVFAEMFSKMEIVPLETNEESLLGNYIKCEYNEKENCYFIFDYRQKIMFCFNENGKFKFSSSHLKGAGPGEYTYGQDFTYNPFDSSYEILKFRGINKYDGNMRYIKSLNYTGVNRYVNYSIPLSKDIHALYYDNFDNLDNGEDILYFYSESEDTIKKMIHFQRTFNYCRSSFYPIYFADSQVYLVPVFSSTLYRIDLESLSLVPVLNVDYGEKTIPENVLENLKNSAESTHEFFEEGCHGYAFTSFILQNENIYCILSSRNQTGFITFHNKNSKKTNSISSTLLNGVEILSPFLLTNDVWYSCTSTSEINSIIDMDYLTEESKLLLSQIKEDDNPVIVKYYLK